jgi:homoserine kinase type II
MKSVFLVLHEYETCNGCDSAKLIGVYSSREKGEAAVLRLSTQPGFRDFLDGFAIDEYKIDEDNWQSGFGGADE